MIGALKTRLTEALLTTIKQSGFEAGLPQGASTPMTWEYPSDPVFGDLSTTLAFGLAKALRQRPRDIAMQIAASAAFPSDLVDRVEVAGAGYLNFFIARPFWRHLAQEILRAGPTYGRADVGGGRPVLVEFVSANPTGPLVVVNARAAAIGDAIARLLEAIGHRPYREYYVNDAGNQFRTLALAMEVRCRQLQGEDCPMPEEAYPGEYLIDLAREFLDQHGPEVLSAPEPERRDRLGRFAVERIIEWQRASLEAYGVTFDGWFSERNLRERGDTTQVIEALKARSFLYEQDGAVWFRSTLFGDDKDRVLVKGDGEITYFLPDIAYHQDKFARGFAQVIDLWGPDHHGYVPRMQAAMQALGHPPGALKILIVQLVRLMRGTEQVRMSKRAGQFVTMGELVDEVGRDAARYTFLTRRCDSQLDFDLELVKSASEENPVYYVQYAHTRLCGILREATRAQLPVPSPEDNLDRLDLPEEIGLIKQLALYPELVIGAAQALEPHRLTTYLHDLAAQFHGYYARHRIISADTNLTRARLTLVAALRVVMANTLGLLGVSAPERM
ncbi:MAG: arginine--tRNA ligase [Candidatus Methylomirabilis oxygeniifera]|uniref:Arginine--tRNA ligase n=1 Tax=Methylomirabilis oxygeniifera TaxID=671143 RepID=D5MFN7_METO1|nr:MAG: arginine--tRNA ligase [Candidatus Methylomirabilis oxyfera]CBE68568.1 arginyl-tRNA synthetase [Candidatus Methylomirabilis oxyfera]